MAGPAQLDRRAVGAIILALSAATLISCEEPELIETGHPISYDYELELPAEFERQEVSGIDSKVEEFHSPDTRISTDFGHYSGPPNCSGPHLACTIEEDEIAGRKALIGTYRHDPQEQPGEPKPYRVFVHVEVDRQQGLALNMFARCDSQVACSEALGYLRAVRLVRAVPPQRTDTNPPPPPPR